MPSWTTGDQEPRNAWFNRKVLIESVCVGAAYGLLMRLVIFAASHTYFADSAAYVMSIAFLAAVPIIMGYFVVYRAERKEPTTVAQWIFFPWISVSLMMIAVALLLIEGAICIAMALPIALIGSSIGGVIGGLVARKRRIPPGLSACIALIPVMLAPLEARIGAPQQERQVTSQILIHASPATVWQNIERVPAITHTELRPNWTHRLGFPRPIEATLSYEGVGGVRHASFEHGLLFLETVTAWEPQQRLAFTIKADTASIPPTTLDEHVTIGGRYFDVLDGEYRIEPLPNGNVMLHLVSHQRLSTDFNVYAGLWTDSVMQSVQSSILDVIQHRCEQQTVALPQQTLSQAPKRLN